MPQNDRSAPFMGHIGHGLRQVSRASINKIEQTLRERNINLLIKHYLCVVWNTFFLSFITYFNLFC